MPQATEAKSVFRIDRFQVPTAARDEFLDRVRFIRDFLSTQPGCRQNLVLEQAGEGERSTIVTVVEWQDATAFGNARAAAAARYRESGFNPQALIERLGIEAAFTSCEPIAF